MMKNISNFNVSEKPFRLIYILYYQSSLLNYLPPNPANYPYIMEYCICNQDVRTDREGYWLTLTLLRLEVWSSSHDISMFCIEKYKRLEMLEFM